MEMKKRTRRDRMPRTEPEIAGEQATPNTLLARLSELFVLDTQIYCHSFILEGGIILACTLPYITSHLHRVLLNLLTLPSRPVLGAPRLVLRPRPMPREEDGGAADQGTASERNCMGYGVEDDAVQREREDDLGVDHIDRHQGPFGLQGQRDEELLLRPMRQPNVEMGRTSMDSPSRSRSDR